AQVSTLWDQDNLYLAVVVNDGTPREANSPDAMGAADSVQIAFSERDGIGSKSQRTGTYQVIMGAVSGRPILQRLSANGRGRGPVNGAILAIRRVGNRAIYEAAIPWSELGAAKPRENTLVRFAVQVNDSDGIRRRVLDWPGGMSGTLDPGRFLALRFTK